jgi:hypothetical protein
MVLIITGIAGLWDGFTTFYGLSEIMGVSDVLGMNSRDMTKLVASAFFALIVTGFLFGTKTIWESSKHNSIAPILKLLWFIAFFYDVYTSFYGNQEFIFRGNINDEQMMMLIGMTVLVSGSPIIYSYLIDDRY